MELNDEEKQKIIKSIEDDLKEEEEKIRNEINEQEQIEEFNESLKDEEPERYETLYDTQDIDDNIEESNSDIHWNEWSEKQIEEGLKTLAEFEIILENQFDNIVKKYSQLIGLDGNSYLNATKMMFYSLIANQLKFNMFTIGANKIDLRIPLLLQLKAGHGKKNYERFIRKTVSGLGKQYQEPTSYHPEQFVGKIIVTENKDSEDGHDYTPVYGTLASDFMVVDEAHALLTIEKNEECLRYMRTALDPIQDNIIEKKQVNVPDEYKLKYWPNCTILLFTQPITNINEDLLIRGSFRRFTILYVDVKEEERLLARRQAKFLTLKEETQAKMWERWIELNRRFLAHKDLKYVCSNYEPIDDYLDKLAKHAKNVSNEVKEFYNTSQFTIKQNIFKMAIIRAIVEHISESTTITIKENHIKAAISDWDKIWMPQVHWIAGQLKMDSLNPKGWDNNSHGLVIRELLKCENKTCDNKHLITILKELYKHQNESTRNTKAYTIMKELVKWGYIKKEGAGKRAGYKITLVKEV